MAYTRENPNQEYFDPLLNKDILIGYCNRNAYQNIRYSRWFDMWYEKQIPEIYYLNKLDPEYFKKLELTIITATWCGRCRTELTRFYKILDVVPLSFKQLDVIYVDRKKQVPGLDLSRYRFTRVPTFIFYNGTTEIARITEQPKDTLEAELFNIQNSNQ